MRKLIQPLSLVACLWLRGVALAAPDAKQLYADACASCHGLDGKGAPTGSAIEVPLPDFTDCNTVTREPDADWSALAAHGGAFLGLSAQMPGFRDALSPEEIHAIVDYIRSFCTEAIIFVDEMVRSPAGKADYRWAKRQAYGALGIAE